MTREEIDTLWQQALQKSAKQNGRAVHDEFAALIEQRAAVAEREACAKVCDIISEDQWALYKGHPPYTGGEPGRASNYTEGKSDGAEVCAVAIRATGEKP